MTAKLGIIGFPIGHSISPSFQQAALDHCGIDASYRAWEVKPGSVAEFMESLRSGDVLGVNVTVPHKESVIPHLDEVDDWAAAAGAVNTVVNRGGKLTGHNTDGTGFLRALRHGGNFDPRGHRALVLGAGGAARGVALALIRQGAGRIIIANRTAARGERLSRMAQGQGVEGQGVEVQAIPLGGDALSAAARSAGLIVNTTTVGMAHGPDENGTPLRHEQIPAAALVNDLVYNPLETPLLREASKAGAAVLGGIHMLVYQGAASFEMWTGHEAPVDVMLRAATQTMASR